MINILPWLLKEAGSTFLPVRRKLTFILCNTFQIHFVGSSKFSLGLSLAIDDVSIDDVSFSKEPCQRIPVNPGKGKTS